MVLPRDYKFKMVFNDLRVFYQTVYPKDEGSPLILDIDETKTLRLKYNQNIFSLQVSDINYDYPSLILYSWKLEGFYEGWSRPGEENVIRFTNLIRATIPSAYVPSPTKTVVLSWRNAVWTSLSSNPSGSVSGR